jgi:hypothetical protein
MLTQVSSPNLSNATPLIYGEFAEKLNLVAQEYGCWPTNCPPSLADRKVDAKVVYIAALCMIERSLYHFNNKKQLIQLIGPIQRLLTVLEDYATPERVEAPSKKRMVARYVHSAMMAYRNSAQGKAQLDEEKAAQQGSRSWEHLQAEGAFDGLPAMIRETLYERVVANMGRQHAHTQARAHERSAPTLE